MEKLSLKKLLFAGVCHLLAVIFSIIMVTLSLVIISNTLANASIAAAQFGDGVSVLGIYTAVIVLCTFQLLFMISCYMFTFVDWFWSSFSFCAIHLLFTLPMEAIIYKFITCFNYSNNQIVIARSCMLILMILASGIGFIIQSARARNKDISVVDTVFLFKLYGVLFSTLAISSTLIGLNIAEMAKLKPQLNPPVGPSTIYMGFFNQTEISSIENNNFSLDSSTLKDRVVGNLGDIVYSDNKRVHSQDCDENNYYLHFYSFEIVCTNKQSESVFFKDCQKNNASSLTVHLQYVDDGAYPKYNCLVNKVNQTCASVCAELFSFNYELVVIQPRASNEANLTSVQRAWTGFSNCNSRPNIRLTHDTILNPCSHANRVVTCGFLLFFLLFVFLMREN